MADDQRPTLSVATIVRNDAIPLQTTLESIEAIADEIVVTDTGSSDDSIAVAEQAGAKLSQFTWSNDFSAARNHCLEQATGDWILWLDAGETLTASAAEELRAFVDGHADRSRAYMMLVLTPDGPQGQAAEQIGRIRLMPRLDHIKFTGRVRESVEASLAEAGLEIDGLPTRIHRGAREHDPEVKLRRARRDLVLAEQEIGEAGADPRLLLTLGEAFRNLAKPAEAAEIFSNALSRSVPGSREMLEAYYGVLTTIGDGTPAGLDRQITTCLAALEIFPVDAQLLCALGGFLVQQGQLDLGVRSFETALDHGQLNPEVYHLVDMEATAAICAATALVSQNQPAKAIAILEKAIAAHPNHAILAVRLAELRVVAPFPTIPAPMGITGNNVSANR